MIVYRANYEDGTISHTMECQSYDLKTGQVSFRSELPGRFGSVRTDIENIAGRDYKYWRTQAEAEADLAGKLAMKIEWLQNRLIRYKKQLEQLQIKGGDL